MLKNTVSFHSTEIAGGVDIDMIPCTIDPARMMGIGVTGGASWAWAGNAAAFTGKQFRLRKLSRQELERMSPAYFLRSLIEAVCRGETSLQEINRVTFIT